jgi:hypothetical protein
LESRARETERERVEENAERFAQVLLPHVGPHRPAGIAPLPGGWRASDEVLTRKSPEACAAVAPAPTETDGSAPTADRVVLSVNTADLGELSLVLDRTPAGVRVVIGVDDARSAEVMRPEREALLARLANNGVRVTSVQIVGRRELGTVLAQARGNDGSRDATPEETVGSHDPTAFRRRGSRKLDLIG